MPDSTTGSAGEKLFDLVQRMLAKNSIERAPSAEEQLTEAGLSSIDMVNLMLAVEAEFDLVIPQEDITPENFRSIATIEALVTKMSARSPSL